jgi:predicted deacylase
MQELPALRERLLGAVNRDRLLDTAVRLGDAVGPGSVLAQVRSPLREVLAEIRAPHGGRIGALRTFGSVPNGEIVAWLCRPAGPTSISDLDHKVNR